MKKPIEILELEKFYSIKLKELKQLPQHENIMFYEFRNHYEVNDEEQIIGLNLSGNHIIEIKGLENLTRLSVLDLSGNDISGIKGLENLTQLSVLDLSGNGIAGIKGLENLTLLSELDLSYNQITEIKSLEELKGLSKLNLSYNQITEIKNLESLKQLSTLYLSYNQITEIKNLESLKRLSTLYLSRNKITEIKNLESLKQLSSLYLSENQIEEIKDLEKLNKLSILDLSKNKLSDITDLLKMSFLKIVNIKGNDKIEIDYPKEVLDVGWEAVKQFSERSKEKVVFRNVKVLLLGNPNIGKSNLLEYLETNHKPVLKNSTHGVQYKKINLNNTNFHIWDFGGQEYFHATHQLFFSNNAINIILWGNEIARDNRVEKCFGIDYWLRIVQQLNCNSEEVVFLTENKIDLNIPKYSEKHISNKFENIFPNLKFYENHISLTELKNLNGYKEKLINISEEIISRFNYPQFYEVFWKRIESLEKNYVTIEEINNRPHKENVVSAMKVFHNMGMLLYFHNILPDKIFVKPQILLKLLYQKVLSDNKKYKITKEEIAKSIQNNTLDLTEKEVIILLEYFNLVFEIEAEKNNYFIPQYLPEQSETQKYFERLGSSFCSIKIKADHYLVSLAMQKLFNVYGKFVDKEKGEYQFWKDGIAIIKDDINVLIKYDAENQLIKLYSSKNSDNKQLQKEIVDFILDLPEDISLPKRNFNNHIKKRWIDVMDEDDEDFTPHFGERLEHYPEYYDEFINRNYKNEYLWKSDYFTVFVSFDGEFFSEWNQLIINDNLREINFSNYKMEFKKVGISEYYFYINKNLEDFMEKEEKGNTIINILDGGIVGAIDNSGTVNVNKKEKSKDDEKQLSIETEKIIDKKIKIWKRNGVICFFVYIIFFILGFIFYKNEWVIFDITKKDWLNFKSSTVCYIIIYGYPFLGIYLFYRLLYDRLFDPSKEKAKRDLLNSKL
ncbi:leucine-rich repeat protein [Chryseobacterium gambrini]|uniref:non-specific serine/threonine protein kinase n=1 Tax=Chryseobacterium gambrini TaxID=373672 RepID=A0ABN7CA72_9FLAO|nr:leucine-rich repeat domain-containing protein [Chryseobacterium gambrini]